MSKRDISGTVKNPYSDQESYVSWEEDNQPIHVVKKECINAAYQDEANLHDYEPHSPLIYDQVPMPKLESPSQSMHDVEMKDISIDYHPKPIRKVIKVKKVNNPPILSDLKEPIIRNSRFLSIVPEFLDKNCTIFKICNTAVKPKGCDIHGMCVDIDPHDVLIKHPNLKPSLHKLMIQKSYGKLTETNGNRGKRIDGLADNVKMIFYEACNALLAEATSNDIQKRMQGYS